jgi:Ca2+-binding EF-hand superfamily protein
LEQLIQIFETQFREKFFEIDPNDLITEFQKIETRFLDFLDDFEKPKDDLIIQKKISFKYLNREVSAKINNSLFLKDLKTLIGLSPYQCLTIDILYLEESNQSNPIPFGKNEVIRVEKLEEEKVYNVVTETKRIKIDLDEEEKKKVKASFINMDYDENGYITSEEYDKYISTLIEDEIKNTNYSINKLKDNNAPKNSILSIEKMKNIKLNHLKQLLTLLKEADLNDDGKISLDEVI